MRGQGGPGSRAVVSRVRNQVPLLTLEQVGEAAGRHRVWRKAQNPFHRVSLPLGNSGSADQGIIPILGNRVVRRGEPIRSGEYRTAPTGGCNVGMIVGHVEPVLAAGAKVLVTDIVLDLWRIDLHPDNDIEVPCSAGVFPPAIIDAVKNV